MQIRAHPTQVHDVVVSVPTYFTDAERRALLDAARYRTHCVIVMVHDVVVSVPTYLTDSERRALLDAARYRTHCVIVISNHGASED
jgi:molecular chaperone DnaK (HSP70)